MVRLNGQYAGRRRQVGLVGDEVRGALNTIFNFSEGGTKWVGYGFSQMHPGAQPPEMPARLALPNTDPNRPSIAAADTDSALETQHVKVRAAPCTRRQLHGVVHGRAL